MVCEQCHKNSSSYRTNISSLPPLYDTNIFPSNKVMRYIATFTLKKKCGFKFMVKSPSTNMLLVWYWILRLVPSLSVPKTLDFNYDIVHARLHHNKYLGISCWETSKYVPRKNQVKWKHFCIMVVVHMDAH